MKATIVYVSQYGGYKSKYKDENGRTQQRSLGKSSRSDADYARAVKTATELGFTISEPSLISAPKTDDSATLDGWVLLYLQRRTRGLRPDSINNYRWVLRDFQFFARSKGLSRLDEITAIHVNEWVDGMDLHASSVVTKLNVISGLFTMAIKEGRIENHPVKYPLAMAREAFTSFKKSTTEPEIKYYSPEQQERYLLALNEGVARGDIRPEVCDIAVLMLFSGLRVKAATYLTFEDVDDTFLNVPKSQDKCGQGYAAFVFPQAREVIDRRRERLGTGRVFPEIMSHRYVWQSIRTAIKRDRRLSDILELGNYCHILRHTHAVNLLGKGVAIEVIKDQLGHLDISTTQIYAKLTRDAHKAALSRISI